MTNEEAKEKLYMEWQKFLENNIDYAGISEAYKMAFKALEQEHCEKYIKEIDHLRKYIYKLETQIEDCISRSSIKKKLQKHRDFFTKAYSGYSYLPQNDKSRVDEITNCISMVVNEPPVAPQHYKAESEDKE